MHGMNARGFGWSLLVAACSTSMQAVADEPVSKPSPPQYEFESIVVPAARSDEAKRATISVKDASEHLEQGALAWAGQRKCVTCHTNGHYMTVRPALTAKLGKPSEDVRKFLIEQTAELKKLPRPQLMSGIRP